MFPVAPSRTRPPHRRRRPSMSRTRALPPTAHDVRGRESAGRTRRPERWPRPAARRGETACAESGPSLVELPPAVAAASRITGVEVNAPSSQPAARHRHGRSKWPDPPREKTETRAVCITVALSRERRARALDESLPPESCDRRHECPGGVWHEHARPVVRRSPAAAQCYTARRTRPPHGRQRSPMMPTLAMPQPAHDIRGREPAERAR
jgi:hypothetical protein